MPAGLKAAAACVTDSPPGCPLAAAAPVQSSLKRRRAAEGAGGDGRGTPVRRAAAQTKGMQRGGLANKATPEVACPATPDFQPESMQPERPNIAGGVQLGVAPGLMPSLGRRRGIPPPARRLFTDMSLSVGPFTRVGSEPRAARPSLGLGWDTELLGRTGGGPPERCGALRPHFPILEAPPGEAQVDMRLAGTAAGMAPLRFEEHFYDGHHFCAPLPYEYDMWPRCGDLGVDLGGRRLPFDAPMEAELLLGYGKQQQQQPKERQPEGRVESIAEDVLLYLPNPRDMDAELLAACCRN